MWKLIRKSCYIEFCSRDLLCTINCDIYWFLHIILRFWGDHSPCSNCSSVLRGLLVLGCEITTTHLIFQYRDAAGCAAPHTAHHTPHTHRIQHIAFPLPHKQWTKSITVILIHIIHYTVIPKPHISFAFPLIKYWIWITFTSSRFQAYTQWECANQIPHTADFICLT